MFELRTFVKTYLKNDKELNPTTIYDCDYNTDSANHAGATKIGKIWLCEKHFGKKGKK